MLYILVSTIRFHFSYVYGTLVCILYEEFNAPEGNQGPVSI